MSDLISRQAAIDTIMGQPPEPHYPSWYAAQIEKLPAAQPTIDAVPVVHAHWVPQHPNNRTGKAYIFVCSNCKKFAIKSRQASIDEMGYVFCPYCGAEMDEE